MRECFCFGGEAVNASGEAVRGLVKSRVESKCVLKTDLKTACFFSFSLVLGIEGMHCTIFCFAHCHDV